MALTTQLRLMQISGSFDDEVSAATSGSYNYSSIQSPLNQMAAQLRRITGASTFYNGVAGAFTHATATFSGIVDATGDVKGATFIPDGDTSAGDAAAFGYTAALGAIITGQGSSNDVTLVNDADATVLGIPTGTTNVDIVGDASAATFKPDGDTSAGDTAAFGYTAALGAIITGQGSSNDVTLVNDADATVLGIPTGTTNVDIVGDLTAATLNADGDTSAGDLAAIGYTTTEGIIVTGQGSTNDVTIKNDADAVVLGVPTGTVNIDLGGDLHVGGNDITMGAGAATAFAGVGGNTVSLADATSTVEVLGTLKTDDIVEKTAAHGVVIDSVTLKDAGVIVGNDGTVGSTGAANAMSISSGGIVTFVDDILIKDGGTIGTSDVADIITLVDTSGDVQIKATKSLKVDKIEETTAAGGVDIDGVLCKDNDIVLVNDSTIGSAGNGNAMAIASTGKVTFGHDLDHADSAWTIGATMSTLANVITLGGGAGVTLGGGKDSQLIANNILGTGAGSLVLSASSGQNNVVSGKSIVLNEGDAMSTGAGTYKGNGIIVGGHSLVWEDWASTFGNGVSLMQGIISGSSAGETKVKKQFFVTGSGYPARMTVPLEATLTGIPETQWDTKLDLYVNGQLLVSGTDGGATAKDYSLKQTPAGYGVKVQFALMRDDVIVLTSR